VPPLVEILETRGEQTASQRLTGCALDRPSEHDLGTSGGDTHSIEVAGWAAGRDRPVVAVEVVTGEGLGLVELPVDLERPDVVQRHPDTGGTATGFRGWVSTLGLPPEFELGIRAVLEGGEREPIATLQGRRQTLESGFEPSIQPLLVTTLARTGSTILVRLLGGHPDIAAYRPFQYEPRVARYWMEILRTLSEPSSYLRQITHAARPNDKHWWVGTGSPLPRPLLDPDLQGWMGNEGVEGLAAVCQQRVDALYGEIARRCERPAATYCVEKYLPNIVPRLILELYPRASEIILVRDFRDMVSSMLALNAKRGYPKFGRERVGSNVEHIRELGRTGVARMLASWRERSDRSHLVRYEDLILRPEDTLEPLLRYLGLDSSPETIAAMRETLSERTDDSDRHRTTADPRSSIGRWRQDLSPELQQECEAALAPALEAFGYEPRPEDSLAEAIR
jgi:hypothetical protein